MKHCFKKELLHNRDRNLHFKNFLHDENQFFLLFRTFFSNLARSYSFFVPLHTQNKGADRIVNKIT